MITIHRKITVRVLGILVLVGLMAASALPASAQRRRVRRPVRKVVTRPVVEPVRYFTVSADTIIRVRMNQRISSGTARIHDRFTTTVVDPVYAGGVEVVPAGSIITGRVTSVQKAQRKSKAGTMGVDFVSIQSPNGTTYPINGSLTSVNGDTETYDNEGGVTGRSSMKRNVIFIGGVAATGALIGAIAGGGKGAGIGAGVGAGLGVAGAYFSKGKEAEVKPGAEFGVILNRSVRLPASNVR